MEKYSDWQEMENDAHCSLPPPLVAQSHPNSTSS